MPQASERFRPAGREERKYDLVGIWWELANPAVLSRFYRAAWMQIKVGVSS